MTTPAAVKFESTLETTDGTSVWHILRVEREKVAHFGFPGNLRRVLCSLNGCAPFNCALFPSKGDYFLTLGKKLRARLHIVAGDTVTVELQKDESKYGMPVPEEFEEVLRQDPEGRHLFDGLSPGDQRLMLKLVVFVKDVDRRIARSLTGLALLKLAGGSFDYHTQHDAMRLASAAAAGVKLKQRGRSDG